MSENFLPVSADKAAGPGAKMRFTSLAPAFDENHHQIYLDLLERALNHNATRNIALTGAYGTGKSSILDRLTGEKYAKRIVRLSLSTIASRDLREKHADADDESSGSRVNQIQKEIVKQLLYRTAPRDVPQSRYRRATVPRKVREFFMGASLGVGAAGLLFLLGVLHPFISSFFAEGWRQITAYGVVVALLVLLAWGAIVVARLRPLMSASVNAAITTVTLSKQSDTYFDAYLDEIVYFFEATESDIVIIEDIDRFEDAEIFDTLRALNVLLNESGQVGRRIVFIYAIRDSVFERIGEPDSRAELQREDYSDDQAKEALKRASRTKFFDVIIPVVPFVSPDNARDLLTKVMKSEYFKIDPRLIRLAARHVADMRMMHNIRNEFEVYRNELVVSKKTLPDITDDLVFAIVLFKNTHLADYEKIRHRDSSLDRLYKVWRLLVADESSASAAQLARLRAQHQKATDAKDHANELRARVLQLRDDLSDAAPANSSMSLDEDILNELGSPLAWAQIAAGGELTLNLQRSSGGSTPFALTSDVLERLLGGTINPADWAVQDEREWSERSRIVQERATFLRHHTWDEFYSRNDFDLSAIINVLTDTEKSRLQKRTVKERVTFADLVTAILPSELARELVRHGHLTSHFALYASKYYGKHLSEEAREYIYRCIGPGEADAIFGLKRRDVRQILREQHADKNDNAELFSDASVLNVNIVDYLLAERPRAAATVARMLSGSPDARSAFVDTYMAHGSDPAALLTQLAPYWVEVIEYAASTETIPSDRRAFITDQVLRVVETGNYSSSPKLARLFENHYQDMEAVTSPRSPQHAVAVFTIIQDAGAKISDLLSLNAYAIEAATSLKLFPVTSSNLRVIVPTGQVWLSNLRPNSSLYAHVLENLSDYLALVRNKPSPFGIANDTKGLVALLHDLQGAPADLLRGVVAACPSGVVVDDLSSVPFGAWPVLFAERRTSTTFANVYSYVEVYGVDTAIALELKRARKIFLAQPVDTDMRTELAYTVLDAATTLPSTLARTQIVKSIEPGVLDPVRLSPEGSDLVARLIKAGLLVDDVSAFSERLMVDWATMEKAIKSSKNFVKFALASALPVVWIPQLLRSADVSPEVKQVIVGGLEASLLTSTIPQTRSIASALIEMGWRLRTQRILALCTAGATANQVILLTAKRGEDLPLDDARQILVALGGEYARAARGGKGRPNFKNDNSHRIVLQRFVGGSIRQLKEVRFKGSGVRLVAHLM